MLNWLASSVITNSTGTGTLSITESYFNNWDHDSKITWLMQVFKEKTDFLCYHLKIIHSEQGTQDAFFLKLEIKDYKVMIDSQNIFDQLIKNEVGKFGNMGQENDCKTCCWLGYPYSKEIWKLIAKKV